MDPSLGFGIPDRRTVLAVLFSLALSVCLFGNTLPFDNTSTFTLFFELVLFTGYLYLARIIVRVAACVLMWTFLSPIEILRFIDYLMNGSIQKAIWHLIASIRDHILVPLFVLTKWQLKQSYVQQNDFFKQRLSKYPAEEYIEKDDYWMGILGVVDRTGVIIIAFLATLSDYHQVVLELGIWGLGLMILTYVLLGRYSFVIQETADQHEQEEQLKAKKMELQSER